MICGELMLWHVFECHSITGKRLVVYCPDLSMVLPLIVLLLLLDMYM